MNGLTNNSIEEYYRMQERQRQREMQYRMMQQSQMGEMAAMQPLGGWPQQSTQPVEKIINKKLLLLTNKV